MQITFEFKTLEDLFEQVKNLVGAEKVGAPKEEPPKKEVKKASSKKKTNGEKAPAPKPESTYTAEECAKAARELCDTVAKLDSKEAGIRMFKDLLKKFVGPDGKACRKVGDVAEEEREAFIACCVEHLNNVKASAASGKVETVEEDMFS